ncbi:hypothetical protein SAMN05443428_102106 [Caloramator quimbayensis]|uniref:Uncharacterized protein n=1 Tax=Caloramator quimbayensis TaxID=1147123 RepID=A0A1T4WMX2_9CLOT|nr:hypothetical protein [Caloramator quimbayensis]SKA78225.1 hypothetical protein SAMN05443428_102106 [Caloramator quimbayensis]
MKVVVKKCYMAEDYLFLPLKIVTTIKAELPSYALECYEKLENTMELEEEKAFSRRSCFVPLARGEREKQLKCELRGRSELGQKEIDTGEGENAAVLHRLKTVTKKITCG